MPSETLSALCVRTTTRTCAHSSVSLAAESFARRLTASTTQPLNRQCRSKPAKHDRAAPMARGAVQEREHATERETAEVVAVSETEGADVRDLVARAGQFREKSSTQNSATKSYSFARTPLRNGFRFDLIKITPSTVAACPTLIVNKSLREIPE